MRSSVKPRFSKEGPFYGLFRIIFVIFFLYLMGDAFFRWDGFRYHSSFSEFLPNVALASILWSFISIIATFVIWMMLRSLTWVSSRLGVRIVYEHLLVNALLFIVVACIMWGGKKIFFSDVKTSIAVKLSVVTAVFVLSLYLSYQLRNEAGKLLKIVQERITPLFWLFLIFVMISTPVIGYQLIVKKNGNGEFVTAGDVTQSNNSRPNIILVTFDALTSRDMSLYGYERPTTPFISKWAETAAVFSNVQAESNWTPPTTASLMTGKRVWTHGLFHSTVPRKVLSESLPAELKKNGYYNVAFIQNQLAHPNRMGILHSFDLAPKYALFVRPTTIIGWSYGALDVLFYRFFGEKFELYNWIISQDFILGQILYRFSEDLTKSPFPPSVVFNKFLEEVEKGLPQPFFAWLHIMPPHDYYLPPDPFMGMFDPSPHLRFYPGKMHKEFKLDEFQRKNAHILRARYDEFIRYCDKQFEDFMGEMDKRSPQNTVIILSSDHGESFEHDYYTHRGPHLYEQVTHIPLLIKVPEMERGMFNNDLVEQIDIPATILDLASIPVPKWMEGRSLIPAIKGERVGSRPAFSMNLDKNPGLGHQIEKGTVAVWEGDYKLIHYLDNNSSLLFNLKNDSGELENLFKKEPEKGQNLLVLLLDNLKLANTRIMETDIER